MKIFSGTDLEATIDDAVATISLSRHPVNAVSTHMWQEIASALTAAVAVQPHAIILRSAIPRIFCAGADLNERFDTPDAIETRQRLVTSTLGAFGDSPVPIVAALDGAVIGGGCALVAQCDIRVATPATTFALTEIDAGRAGGARHLMRHLDQGTVRWMALTGRRLSADEALSRGLVTFMAEDADEAARDIADCIAGKSRDAVELLKRSLDLVENLRVEEGYDVEQQISALLIGRASGVNGKPA